MKPEKAKEALDIFEELLKEGIITHQEYLDKKKDILNLVERTSVKEESNSNNSSRRSSVERRQSQSGSFSYPSSPSTPVVYDSTIKQEDNTLHDASNNSNSNFNSKSSYSGDVDEVTSRRMEMLQRLCITNNDQFEFLHQFLILDKEFDGPKMMEFIKILMEKDKLPFVVNEVIKLEIDRNKSGLLREESLGSCLLRHYWFNYEGKQYLKTVVSPLVKEIISLTTKKPLEIDSSKVSAEQAQKNLNKLLNTLKSFLTTFCSSQKMFPFTFRLIIHNFYGLLTESEGSGKAHLGLGYSEDALRLFGAFLLLRFICPAIVSPKRYGLVKNEINMHTQRALVLISKILQAIASQVEFEEKEQYMLQTNEFVRTNIPQLLGFFLQLADGEELPVSNLNDKEITASKSDKDLLASPKDNKKDSKKFNFLRT